MTIEERLEMLERELAEMKARKVIQANAFIVKDEKGMIRACLSVNEDGPCLSLYDEEGKPRAELAATKTGSNLALCDENGVPRAMLAATEEWLGPTLTLNDENGKPHVQLAVNQPQAVLYRVKGEQLPVSVLKNASWLRLTDENGKTCAALAATLNGPELSLRDKNGKPRAELSVSKPRAGLDTFKNEPMLSLYDENGKSIWESR